MTGIRTRFYHEKFIVYVVIPMLLPFWVEEFVDFWFQINMWKLRAVETLIRYEDFQPRLLSWQVIIARCVRDEKAFLGLGSLYI